MDQPKPMTEESIRRLLEAAGARVASRGGRSDNYGAPRDFSFEVKGIFPNGLMLHIVARQFNYREAWETQGRVNDLVDVSLLRDGQFSELPKGYPYFQGRDSEEGLDEVALITLIDCVGNLNPKLFLLQKLTGDL
ncbi:MAG: hypothetical protein A2X84_03540 [Desulfuromonadaceae bacterium GWC2_58_13]|nr:MAG: hypothetical protein A2X84_03540 [Desulfuromonadaceae bacterium GWC2_58_13]